MQSPQRLWRPFFDAWLLDANGGNLLPHMKQVSVELFTSADGHLDGN